MDNNYREFLERKQNEAMAEFEAAKAEAIAILEKIDPYYAQDWGTAYYTKIDKVTAAGAKVMQWAEALKAYNYFNKEEQ